MNIITSFNQLNIKEKTLIILDIDETILMFENINQKWWETTFNKYYKINNDYDLSDELSLKEWEKYINDNIPRHTDEIGFNNIKNNPDVIDIIFLTSRNISLKEITNRHFDILNIYNRHIIYCNNNNKGNILFNEYINKYNNKYKNIIFVDDLIQNLYDVKGINNNIDCYLFSNNLECVIDHM